ncbi:MAG: PqqD family protein [Thermodesulfobacteriota bacterium]
MNSDKSRKASRDEEGNPLTGSVANGVTADSKTKVNTAQQMSARCHIDTLKDDDVPFVDLHSDAHNDSIDIVYSRPCRRNGIEEHILLDEIVLYYPEREVAFSLNSSAKAIWELCDGKHTVIEISQKLSKRFACSAAELLSDVTTTITKLQKLSLLEVKNAPRTKST